MQPTPSWDDFIQNALISCFINLEPQAAMFEAAGELGACSAGKEGKLAVEEETQRNYARMFANTLSGALTTGHESLQTLMDFRLPTAHGAAISMKAFCKFCKSKSVPASWVWVVCFYKKKQGQPPPMHIYSFDIQCIFIYLSGGFEVTGCHAFQLTWSFVSILCRGFIYHIGVGGGGKM